MGLSIEEIFFSVLACTYTDPVRVPVLNYYNLRYHRHIDHFGAKKYRDRQVQQTSFAPYKNRLTPVLP